MNHNHSVVRSLSATVSLALGALACAHTPLFHYGTDDPVAEAVCAFTDSGDYRVLAIRSSDSLIVPIDSSLPAMTLNLERPPGGFYVFLKPEGMPGNQDRPSDAQLAFMRQYNSVIMTLLRSLADHPTAVGAESLPPNLRLKLSGCGGRLKGKGPS